MNANSDTTDAAQQQAAEEFLVALAGLDRYRVSVTVDDSGDAITQNDFFHTALHERLGVDHNDLPDTVYAAAWQAGLAAYNDAMVDTYESGLEANAQVAKYDVSLGRTGRGDDVESAVIDDGEPVDEYQEPTDVGEFLSYLYDAAQASTEEYQCAWEGWYAAFEDAGCEHVADWIADNPGWALDVEADDE